MIPVTDIIAQIVATMVDPLVVDDDGKAIGPVYYEYGTTNAVNLLLTAKDSKKIYKYQKFPLVFVRMDYPATQEGGMEKYDLNIGIMGFTTEQYTTRERYTKVFRPQLYPLYEQFLKGLRYPGRFSWAGTQDRPPHERYDRPYWGSTEARDKRMFSDPLDCVELVSLRINQRIKLC